MENIWNKEREVQVHKEVQLHEILANKMHYLERNIKYLEINSYQNRHMSKSKITNFTKFFNNIDIILHLYENQKKKAIDFISKLLQISKIIFKFFIRKYFKLINKQNQIILKNIQKKLKIESISAFINEFMNSNKGRWIAIW